MIKDRMSPGPSRKTHAGRLTELSRQGMQKHMRNKAEERQALLDRWRELGSPPIELPSGATIPDLERFLRVQELTMRQIAEALS